MVLLIILRRISMLPYTARFDAEGRLSPASMVWLPLRDTVLPSTTCEASAYVRTKGDLMSHGRPAILAEGLEKSYGKNRALRGLDLAAEEGTVLGLFGPNGAGKTTAVRILATLLRPDAGRAEVAGLDVVQGAERLRSRIGLTGQYAAVDEYLTGRENLEMFGRLYRLSKKQARRRADELLERFDLADAASRLVKTYSGGMRRRLDLAASLVVSPPVLFLDEPTTGLDPRSRLAVWDLIAELVAGGTTLLLTTQYLEEADRLADRIAVVDAGRVIAEGTFSELKARVGGERWRSPCSTKPTSTPPPGSSSPIPTAKATCSSTSAAAWLARPWPAARGRWPPSSATSTPPGSSSTTWG
jgi:daunorubicin resistance ABC transporter ATP-binding subunit